MASSFRLSTKNLGRLQVKLTSLPEKMRKEVRDEVALAAFDIRTTAILKIQKVSPGRIYPRGTKNHIASLPGDPPNTDSGRLIQSIDVEIRPYALSALVGTNIVYGPWLEFGTLKMAPRPWLKPSFDENIDKATQRIRDAVSRVIARNTRKG